MVQMMTTIPLLLLLCSAVTVAIVVAPIFAPSLALSLPDELPVLLQGQSLEAPLF